MARFTGNCEVIEATVANGATGLSGAIDIGGHSMLALYMPGTWQAAAITFLAAPTIDGTYQSVYDDDGNEVAIAADDVVASRCITLNTVAAKLAPYRFIKLRSGIAATPVNQTADRAIKIIVKSQV
jgi:hypothetical protein